MINAAALTSALDGKKEGNSWRCLCPVHHGHSLIVSIKQGKLLLHCMQGCPQDEVIEELRKAGLWGEEPGEGLLDRITSFPTRQLVEEYDYVVAVKGRFIAGGRKLFAWRRKEDKEWKGLRGLRERDLPLYRANELGPGVVVVVEGEKAANACWEHGLQAVCPPGGAESREFGQQLSVLSDHEVILWPDNDEVGRELMRRIARLLGRPVAFVQPDGLPERGDAYDYFVAQGRSKEELLKLAQRREPEVSRLLDGYSVRLPEADCWTHWEFRDLEVKARSFEADVTCWMEGPGLTDERFEARLNLQSLSGRESFRRALDEMFGKREWTAKLNRACYLVRQAYRNEDTSVDLSLVEPRPAEQRYRVYPLFPDGQHAVIFGNGSSGKSYLMYWIALMVATGQIDTFPHIPQRVLWLDYETDAQTARYRLDRLMAGLGLFWQPGLIDYRNARGEPLCEIIDSVERTVRTRDIGLVIIDHGAAATGDEPEKAFPTLRYFNALSRLAGVTVVTICHVSQEIANEPVQLRPFGSVFWSNLPRITWNVQKQQSEEDHVMHLGVFNRKPPADGPPLRPLGFRITFEEGGGPVRVEREDVRDIPELEVARPLHQRVYDALLALGEASARDLVEYLNVPERDDRQVRRALRVLAQQQRIIKLGMKAREATWAALQPDSSSRSLRASSTMT